MLAPLLLASVLAAAPPFVPDAIMLAAAPLPASALAGEGFSLLEEEQGVRVYGRAKRAGLEFAAECTLPAPPARVRRVLLDYPSHARWQKRLRDNRVLARGADFLDVYQRLSPPVIDDRDYTLHVTWGDDGAVLWTRFVTANDRGPAPVRGVVRISDHDGAFRLEPIDGGRGTHAVYRFYIDMAGSVPVGIARSHAAKDIPEFFVNVGKQLAGYP